MCAIHLHSPDLCPPQALPQGAAIWLPTSAHAQEKVLDNGDEAHVVYCARSPSMCTGQKLARGASEQMEQVDQAVGDY